MDTRIPPLEIKIMRESNPLKSRILVRTKTKIGRAPVQRRERLRDPALQNALRIAACQPCLRCSICARRRCAGAVRIFAASFQA